LSSCPGQFPPRQSRTSWPRPREESLAVMLLEPEQTQYDLRFSILGIRVRVHPLFWLTSVILGWNLVNVPEIGTGNGLLNLVLWVACVFVWILLHEMGHVVMGRLFGSEGHIVLLAFGGLAIGSANLRERWQRIAVSAAGPAIQLVLWGILYLLREGR